MHRAEWVVREERCAGKGSGDEKWGQLRTSGLRGIREDLRPSAYDRNKTRHQCFGVSTYVKCRIILCSALWIHGEESGVGRAVRRERLGGEGGTVEDVWPSRHHPTHPTNHLI